tara:strand:+ start:911 stop:1069 length:159 start_codon:yes stop_codon:yes gene_type:complete
MAEVMISDIIPRAMPMIATQAEKDKNRNLYFENEYLIANLSASNLNLFGYIK